MCCSAAAFSVVIDLLSWYGRISWSGRETNATAMPISKHVVVLIPNSASLRGETTVMATASIATKKPPYCNRMPLREKDVIFFFLFFLRQNFVSRRLFCALNNNLFYEDDDRYCSIKVMVYPSTTVYVYSKSHHHLFACRTRHGTQKNAHNKLCPCVEETSPHRNYYYYYYTIFNVHV
mmetsp:Transcript_3819/g.11750  ORF Transcript_3819/g.11750 Transcript_3819/m.11750 type:complete len:178 (+) Transcript_3819:981-1514(+)